MPDHFYRYNPSTGDEYTAPLASGDVPFQPFNGMTPQGTGATLSRVQFGTTDNQFINPFIDEFTVSGDPEESWKVDYRLHSGLSPNAYVSAVHTANVSTLTGNTFSANDGQTAGSVSLSAGDIVFLVGQTTKSQNGPWVIPVSSGANWTRPIWYATGMRAWQGMSFHVAQGDMFINTRWHLITQGTLTIGTSNLEFRRYDAKRARKIISAAYTISKYMYPAAYIGVSSSTNPGFALTLPPVADFKDGDIIVKMQTAAISGTNPVTLTPNGVAGAEKIDGANTVVINGGFIARHLFCDGLNWYVV